KFSSIWLKLNTPFFLTRIPPKNSPLSPVFADVVPPVAETAPSDPPSPLPNKRRKTTKSTPRKHSKNAESSQAVDNDSEEPTAESCDIEPESKEQDFGKLDGGLGNDDDDEFELLVQRILDMDEVRRGDGFAKASDTSTTSTASATVFFLNE
ncbi:hypothetical protein FRC09_001357, partial [Ceratobasidium sp. 395]